MNLNLFGKSFYKLLIFFLTLQLFSASPNFNIDLDSPPSSISNNEFSFLTIKGSSIPTFGAAISNAGDFNGDGIDDMIIGSAGTGSQIPKVYIIYGQKEGFPAASLDLASLDITKGFAIQGPSSNTQFGSSVSGIRDFNQDGYDDVIIGEPEDVSLKGMAYVIYGRKYQSSDIDLANGLNSDQGFSITGPSISSKLGISISSAGDVNGDGTSDIIIGASGSGAGAAYVIYGKKGWTGNIDVATLNTDQGFAILGSVNGGQFAFAVSGAGDFNNDGTDDVVVSAPWLSEARVYIIYGKKGGLSNFNIDSMTPSQGTSVSWLAPSGSASVPSSTIAFGCYVGPVGDMNGDKIDDIIMASCATGNSYVIYGREDAVPYIAIQSLTSAQRFSLTGQTTTPRKSGASAGDLNGDGSNDLVVRYQSGTGTSGIASIVFGNSAPMANVAVSSTGLSNVARISGNTFSTGGYFRVVDKGDFNNDHIDDLILSAPLGTSDNTNGAVYIVFGSNGCPKYCSSCSSATTCLVCFPEHGLVNSLCVTCPQRTFLSQGTCLDCPENCVKCLSNSTCQVCDEGYSLANSQYCVSKGLETQAAVSDNLVDGVSVVSNSFAAGSSVPFNFGLVAKLLRNTRYLNISVSLELQKTFYSWKTNSSLISVPSSWNSYLKAHPLPFDFERYGLESAFLINYWKNFVLVMAGGICFLICKILEMSASSSSQKLKKVTRSIKIAVSNLVLTQFYGSFDDVLFYFVLEIRSARLSSLSVFEMISFVLSLVFLILGVIVLGVHISTIIKYQREKKGDSLDKFLERSEEVKLFYKDFHHQSHLQQFCLLVHVVRSLLSSLVITLLLGFPVAQLGLLIFLNALAVIYLFLQNPFKKFHQACGQYICEFALLLADFSLLVVASTNPDNESTIEKFSKVVIYTNLVLVYAGILFIVFSVALMFYQVYQDRKLLNKELPQISKTRITRPTNQDQSVLIGLHPNQSQTIIGEGSFNRKNSMIQGTKNLNDSSFGPQDISNFSIFAMNDSNLISHSKNTGKNSKNLRLQKMKDSPQKKPRIVQKVQIQDVRTPREYESSKPNYQESFQSEKQFQQDSFMEVQSQRAMGSSEIFMRSIASLNHRRNSGFERTQRTIRGENQENRDSSSPRKDNTMDYERFIRKRMLDGGGKNYEMNWKLGKIGFIEKQENN